MHVPMGTGYGFKNLPMAAPRPVKTIDKESRVTVHAVLPRQPICRIPLAEKRYPCSKSGALVFGEPIATFERLHLG